MKTIYRSSITRTHCHGWKLHYLEIKSYDVSMEQLENVSIVMELTLFEVALDNGREWKFTWHNSITVTQIKSAALAPPPIEIHLTRTRARWRIQKPIYKIGKWF